MTSLGPVSTGQRWNMRKTQLTYPRLLIPIPNIIFEINLHLRTAIIDECLFYVRTCLHMVTGYLLVPPSTSIGRGIYHQVGPNGTLSLSMGVFTGHREKYSCHCFVMWPKLSHSSHNSTFSRVKWIDLQMTTGLFWDVNSWSFLRSLRGCSSNFSGSLVLGRKNSKQQKHTKHILDKLNSKGAADCEMLTFCPLI